MKKDQAIEMLREALKEVLEVLHFEAELPPRPNQIEINHFEARKKEFDNANEHARHALRATKP